MRTTMIIAAREIRERAQLLWISVICAVAPFAVALLPGMRGRAGVVVPLVGITLAGAVSIGIALTLGASTVVRDLTERRMSFFFTKPVGAAALWFGKASGSLLIALACFFLIATPSVFVRQRTWGLSNADWSLLFATLIFVAFVFSHALISMTRSRSPLLALDFLFASLSLGAIYLIVRPLVAAAAIQLVATVMQPMLVAFVVVLAVAPVWQLANGRSEMRRSHVALMRFLWPAIAVVLLVAGGAVAWLVSVSPEDLVVTHVDQPSRGTMMVVSGRAPGRRDFYASFLIDRANGSVRRIEGPPWKGMRFSEDGKVAVWAQPSISVRATGWHLDGFELHTTNGATGIVVPPAGGSFVLSGDGSRAAVSNGSQLAVYELATGKLLTAAAGLDGSAEHQLFFATPELVRVIESQPRIGTMTPLRVFEVDVRARTTRKTGERMIGTRNPAVAASADGSRMLVLGAGLVVDGRTTESILTLPAARAGTMLRDGRVVLVTNDAGGKQLRTFERDGTPRHVIPIAEEVRFAGETENGKLILAGAGTTMYVFDLAGGRIERRLEGLRGPVPRPAVDPRLAVYAADQEFAAVKDGALTTWR